MVKEDNGTVYQIGLVSFGTDNCGVGEPGVYTKITHHIWPASCLVSA